TMIEVIAASLITGAGLAVYYPGWYSGLTIHIYKVRKISGSETTSRSLRSSSSTILSPIRLLRGSPATSGDSQTPQTSQIASSRKPRAMDGAIQKNVGDRSLLVLSKNVTGYTGTFNMSLRTTS